MTDTIYTSHARVEKVDGLHRRAGLETGVQVDFGVHGPIKEHYGLQAPQDLPLPVDYVVAATGA